MSNILQRIIQHKRQEVQQAMVRKPRGELEKELDDAPAVRDFFAPLAVPGPVKLIAEFKRASPSAGTIRSDLSPQHVARMYEEGGASALSVLTDVEFFRGCPEDLKAARGAVKLPVLRKDFIIDPYQVLEARCLGADAVLLIAECLDDCQLRSLYRCVLDLGMTPLVEIYKEENLQRVLDLGATLIGVNNRNLETFQVDTDHAVRLRLRIPDHCVVVAESGIRSRQDVEKLQQAGIDAILVGQSLMQSGDIVGAVRQLLGRS